MNIYEINSEIDSCIDMETGEILDEEKFHSLKMDKQEKLENIVLLAKNFAVYIAGIKEEEKKLKNRRKSAEKTISWCKETLKRELCGKKFKDKKGRFSVYYMPSKAIKINEFDFIPKKYIKEIPTYMQENLVKKTALRKALESGEKVPGAELVENVSVCIR